MKTKTKKRCYILFGVFISALLVATYFFITTGFSTLSKKDATVVTITSPQDKEYEPGSISIEATTSKAVSGCSYSIDKGEETAMSGSGTAWSGSAAMAEGKDNREHKIAVKCIDLGGKESSSKASFKILKEKDKDEEPLPPPVEEPPVVPPVEEPPVVPPVEEPPVVPPVEEPPVVPPVEYVCGNWQCEPGEETTCPNDCNII